MKQTSIAEINEKIKSLQREERLLKHQVREAEKKRKQRLCFNVGELFIKHFPNIQDIEPRLKNENAKIFAPLERFFKELTSNEKIMALFNECLTSIRNNQAQCVSGQTIRAIRRRHDHE